LRSYHNLSLTQKRDAQIEKEALAVTWASKRLRDTVETDHKPLVPLLSSKNLEELPIRIQHFCLQLIRFNYTMVRVPGKSLCTADVLSQSPIHTTSSSDLTFQKEVDAYVNLLIDNLPATDTQLIQIKT